MTITACVGRNVIVLVEPGTNGCTDEAPATITQILGTGPNSGVLVNVHVMPNNNGVGQCYGLCGVELFLYKSEAEILGPGRGAFELSC